MAESFSPFWPQLRHPADPGAQNQPERRAGRARERAERRGRAARRELRDEEDGLRRLAREVAGRVDEKWSAKKSW